MMKTEMLLNLNNKTYPYLVFWYEPRLERIKGKFYDSLLCKNFRIGFENKQGHYIVAIYKYDFNLKKYNEFNSF